MGIGTGLAFIAIGAIIAFAFRFNLSGIDIHMVGWILILVGVAMLLFTLLYTRPRRRRQVVGTVDQDPAYVAAPPPDEELVVRERTTTRAMDPRVQNDPRIVNDPRVQNAPAADPRVQPGPVDDPYRPE